MSELTWRRLRSDRGCSRLPAQVEKRLQTLLSASDPARPSLGKVHRELARFCRAARLPVPARATVYNALARVVPPSLSRAGLPESVRTALHNVGGREVPGHQVVFAALNYGDTRALSYAAGLPWSCLRGAARLRGWRPKSLALLRAVMSYRGI